MERLSRTRACTSPAETRTVRDSSVGHTVSHGLTRRRVESLPAVCRAGRNECPGGGVHLRFVAQFGSVKGCKVLPRQGGRRRLGSGRPGQSPQHVGRGCSGAEAKVAVHDSMWTGARLVPAKSCQRAHARTRRARSSLRVGTTRSTALRKSTMSSCELKPVWENPWPLTAQHGGRSVLP